MEFEIYLPSKGIHDLVSEYVRNPYNQSTMYMMKEESRKTCSQSHRCSGWGVRTWPGGVDFHYYTVLPL